MLMTKNQDDGRKEKMIEELHKMNNTELHQKSLIETIIYLTPVLTKVIEQGLMKVYLQRHIGKKHHASNCISYNSGIF